ncbi:uncharacterized protein LOC121933880 [Sceloporus undulatus]|uniref:uncharacterized protein LOC121933880 n=1 Tax=Sceloporus undulatus TaxID=8520 RepID=UPI001C4D955C|nr:uncharacterized protein LOC121933880 [Sceloporus undulatus]
MEISHWMVLILLSVLSQGSRGQDSVTQAKDMEIGKEGETASFGCNYNTNSFNSLHWYRQYPGEGPTFLLMLILEGPESKGNFHAKLDKKKRQSHLNIRGVQFTDAATYFCALKKEKGTHFFHVHLASKAFLVQNAKVTGWELTNKKKTLNLLFYLAVGHSQSQVTQTPAFKEVREGDLFTISCAYSSEFRTYFWYQQLPGKAPSLLLSITTGKNVTEKNFTAEYLEKGKQSLLHLSSSQLQYSGTYFCAVEAQWGRKQEAHSQNLRLFLTLPTIVL